jgi:hypothetical protein
MRSFTRSYEKIVCHGGDGASVPILVDVIYAVSGKFVDTIESLRSALDDLKTADAIVLQVERLGTLRYVVLETDK